MRLLLTTDAVGGVWRYSLELAASLAADVVLAVLGPTPNPAQRREAEGLAESLKIFRHTFTLGVQRADSVSRIVL